MFSRADADQLRESLAPIDFSSAATVSESLDRYRSHYGIEFDESLSVRHVLGKFTSGGFTLACHHFALPADEQIGTAFILHGYFDHTGIYHHLIRHCLQRGLSVVMFDMPGHGLSSGPIAGIDSFQQYALALIDCLTIARQQDLRQPWVSIGQSTGGAVLVDALLHNNLDQFPIERYVLLAPLLRPRAWGQTRLLFAITKHFLASTRRGFSTNSHDQDFLTFLKTKDALQSRSLPRDWVIAMIDYMRRFEEAAKSEQPLTIIQGDGDMTVDWRFNLPKFQQKFPATTISMISQGRHHLVNESEEYRSQIFAMLDQALAGIIQ